MKKVLEGLITSKIIAPISDALNLKISNSFNKKVENHFHGPVTFMTDNSKKLKNKTENH
jgi:hypothetical protein